MSWAVDENTYFIHLFITETKRTTQLEDYHQVDHHIHKVVGINKNSVDSAHHLKHGPNTQYYIMNTADEILVAGTMQMPRGQSRREFLSCRGPLRF